MNNQSGPTIRLKLTLLYGVLFLIASLILISVTYALVRREFIASAPPLNVNVIQNRTGDEDDRDIDDEDPEERDNRARREFRSYALRQLWRQSLLALLITGSGALLLGWIVAGRVLDPIRQITDHAQHASIATLGERIELQGPSDELKDLADTFDSMLDRLQAAFEAQQGFAAQASHELRTPLAIVRAEAELAANAEGVSDDERTSLNAILTAVGRSEQLIDGLLALSKSESTMLEMLPLDLAELVGDVVGELANTAAQAGVRLELHLEPAMVNGDAGLLGRLASNLVQNGITYNQPGGQVDIAISSDEYQATVAVSNTGPIVPQDEIDNLFKPFERGEWARRNRGGHGLGLAIVQSVAIAHQGTVSARPGPDGGLTVTVQFPVSAVLE